MSRVESGEYAISDREISRFLGWCRADSAETEYALELQEMESRGTGYWLRSLDDGSVTGAMRSLAYHEATAVRLTYYESEQVPDLLQTDGYAVHLASASGRSQPERQQVVRCLLDRQAVLSRTPPGEFTFFVREAALRLQVGEPQVMHEQLLHLIFSASRPNVRIRIIPATAGAGSVFRGAFALFEYGTPHRPLVHLDGWTGGLFIDDRNHLACYQELRGRLNDVALDDGSSLQLCADLANEFDRSF